MGATLNGSRTVSARFLIPWRGVWLCDIDADPEDVNLLPTKGPAALVLGDPPATVTSVVGVIDPLFSGAFVSTSRIRVVGGAGGWSKNVSAQHFHNDAGLPRSVVLAATGAEVLEAVTELVPAILGVDYVRSAGPASRVFGDADWWVDLTSPTTFVGPRPPAVPDPSLELLHWDPLQKRAEVTCDTLVVPGTVLVDPRIPESPLIVRDVEQTFDHTGSRATLWCSTNAASRLQAALRALVREVAQVDYLKVWKYRFVALAGGKLALQAVSRSLTGAGSPVPDLLPLSEWTGLPGATSVPPPGLEVLVAFVGGDPSQPMIVGYSTQAIPISSDIDAEVAITIGKSAPSVSVGALPAPLAHAIETEASLTAIAAMCTAIGTLLVTPPTSTTFSAFAPAAAPLFSGLAATIAAFLATLPTVVLKGE